MIFLLRYGELHLKGLNRPHFEKLQKQAIARAIAPFEGARVERGQGRFFVTGIRDEDESAALRNLSRVFGLHSISPAREVAKTAELQEAKEVAADLAREWLASSGRKDATFKVEAKRADKRFASSSMQIARDVGEYVLEHVPGLTVDVHDPDFRIYVEVREQCWVYTQVIPGAGGLPARSSGRGLLLLSGGIDSPVAGYEMARRGLELNAVHYHSFPYTSEAAREKVIRLARIVAQYAGRIYLHIVPLTEIQTKIHELCPPEMMVLLTRRFMMRIAAATARRNDCGALITGENLGQVASQTIESIAVTDCVADMPVFRPLIALDKLDIIRKAEKIGTYATSIEPYEDCCTVFVPKHPLTHPHLDRIEAAESVLPIRQLVDEALAQTELVIVDADGVKRLGLKKQD